MLDQATLVTLGLLLIISGFIVTFLAVFLSFIRSIRAHEKVRSGGLIMIGPIPIVFGTDKETVKILLVLSLILVVLVLILMLLLRVKY